METPNALTLPKASVASDGRFAEGCQSTTRTCCPHWCKWVAASKPSPPLLPGPQKIQKQGAHGLMAMANLATDKPACAIKLGPLPILDVAKFSSWRVCATSNNASGSCQLIFFKPSSMRFQSPMKCSAHHRLSWGLATPSNRWAIRRHGAWAVTRRNHRAC